MDTFFLRFLFEVSPRPFKICFMPDILETMNHNLYNLWTFTEWNFRQVLRCKPGLRPNPGQKCSLWREAGRIIWQVPNGFVWRIHLSRVRYLKVSHSSECLRWALKNAEDQKMSLSLSKDFFLSLGIASFLIDLQHFSSERERIDRYGHSKNHLWGKKLSQGDTAGKSPYWSPEFWAVTKLPIALWLSLRASLHS